MRREAKIVAPARPDTGLTTGYKWHPIYAERDGSRWQLAIVTRKLVYRAAWRSEMPPRIRVSQRPSMLNDRRRQTWVVYKSSP